VHNLEIRAILQLKDWLTLHDRIEAFSETDRTTYPKQREFETLRRQLAGMQLDPAIESMDIELRRELYGFRKSEGWVCTESGEGQPCSRSQG
jgi:hypothetical protein